MLCGSFLGLTQLQQILDVSFPTMTSLRWYGSLYGYGFKQNRVPITQSSARHEPQGIQAWRHHC